MEAKESSSRPCRRRRLRIYLGEYGRALKYDDMC
jgi:hypothetical protein